MDSQTMIKGYLTGLLFNWVSNLFWSTAIFQAGIVCSSFNMFLGRTRVDPPIYFFILYLGTYGV